MPRENAEPRGFVGSAGASGVAASTGRGDSSSDPSVLALPRRPRKVFFFLLSLINRGVKAAPSVLPAGERRRHSAPGSRPRPDPRGSARPRRRAAFYLLDVHQLRLEDLRDGDVVLGGDGEAALGAG